MTIKTMGIRDLVRESKNITDYDMVNIKDKKTGEHKGVFVSYHYADDVKKMILARRKARVDELMSIAGFASGEFGKDKKAVQKIKSKMK